MASNGTGVINTQLGWKLDSIVHHCGWDGKPLLYCNPYNGCCSCRPFSVQMRGGKQRGGRERRRTRKQKRQMGFCLLASLCLPPVNKSNQGKQLSISSKKRGYTLYCPLCPPFRPRNNPTVIYKSHENTDLLRHKFQFCCVGRVFFSFSCLSQDNICPILNLLTFFLSFCT